MIGESDEAGLCEGCGGSLDRVDSSDGVRRLRWCGGYGRRVIAVLLVVVLMMMQMGFVNAVRGARSGGDKYKDERVVSRTGEGGDIEKWFEDYKSYEDIISRLTDSKGGCRYEMDVVSIGKTYEGRNIMAARINTGGKSDKEKRKKRVLVTGTLHAREWIAGMTGMYVVERLCGKEEEKDKKIEGDDGRRIRNVDLRDDVEVVVVPVVNPDGFEYSRIDDTTRYWRKNRRPTKGDFVGVDLNRNWEYGFGKFGEKGSSSNPSHEQYRGEKAFSENETIALRDFVENEDDFGPVVTHVDLHSYGALILRGLFWQRRDDAIDPAVRKSADRVGRAMRVAMRYTEGTNYKYGPGYEELYQATGVMTDWLYKKGVVSLTVELRPNFRNAGRENSRFHLPEEQILPTAKEFFEGFKVLVKQAQDPDKIPTYTNKEVETLGSIDAQPTRVDMIVAIVASIVFVLLFSAAIYYFCVWRRKNRQNRKGAIEEIPPPSRIYGPSSFNV
eukprot:Plantae.Rhodophyta-Hildenbrandia_rubra.ctg13721.p1 GENE.Plantae.Rhodophyta-Hildenbrandia_rubra.ctg13721~~Plantae.Rhodophyta-Hildenbrandia_rubra.ctg13721.p1  ORF type:complete len:499 (-),score=102.92 Plantae.Rhodophyta-Hildenbrandia_rubra.ctg13721:513-2009(-)